jgi:hypothetical protein
MITLNSCTRIALTAGLILGCSTTGPQYWIPISGEARLLGSPATPARKPKQSDPLHSYRERDAPAWRSKS